MPSATVGFGSRADEPSPRLRPQDRSRYTLSSGPGSQVSGRMVLRGKKGLVHCSIGGLSLTP
jgi:hypothetical protein